MMKRIVILSTVIVLVAILVSYIGVGFHKIENAYSTRETLLLTKQSQLQQNLNDYIDSFETVSDRIFSNDVRDKGHLYNLEDMEQDDDILTLMNNCNVEWAQINSDLNKITFYQTALIKDNEVILSYVCYIDQSGKKRWGITKKFPDFSRDETIVVKLYNFIYNRAVI